MLIHLCKRSLDRLGAGQTVLLSALRDREHSPVLKDCLDRCQRCDLGFVMATAGGMPISVRTVEQLLSDIDELAAEEE